MALYRQLPNQQIVHARQEQEPEDGGDRRLAEQGRQTAEPVRSQGPLGRRHGPGEHLRRGEQERHRALGRRRADRAHPGQVSQLEGKIPGADRRSMDHYLCLPKLCECLSIDLGE